MSTEINKVHAQPAVRESITRLGAEPAGNTPEDFSAFIVAERKQQSDVIGRAGIVLA